MLFDLTMGRFIEVVNHGMNFSKYPITIYPKIMRILLLYLIPIGVISFIPTTYIFKLPKDFNILLIGFSFISYTIIVSAIWKKGVRSYKGVGNYE